MASVGTIVHSVEVCELENHRIYLLKTLVVCLNPQLNSPHIEAQIKRFSIPLKYLEKIISKAFREQPEN